MSLKRSFVGVVRKRLFTDGGGWAVGVGLTGCLCFEAILAFMGCWVLPFLRVSTMVMVRV